MVHKVHMDDFSYQILKNLKEETSFTQQKILALIFANITAYDLYTYARKLYMDDPAKKDEYLLREKLLVENERIIVKDEENTF